MDHILLRLVDLTNASYGSIPVIGSIIVSAAVLIALGIKFGTDSGEWTSPPVVLCGLLAITAGLFVYVGLPSAKTYCKHLWKEGTTTTLQEPLGPSRQYVASAEYTTDHCAAIVNCSKQPRSC
jgi:hypothetical protein